MISNFDEMQKKIQYKTMRVIINEIAIVLLCFLFFILYEKIRLLTM